MGKLAWFSSRRTELPDLFRHVNRVLESHGPEELLVNFETIGKKTLYQFGVKNTPISPKMEIIEALGYLNGYMDGQVRAKTTCSFCKQTMCVFCGQHQGVYRHGRDGWWMCWVCQPHMTTAMLSRYESGLASLEELAELIKEHK